MYNKLLRATLLLIIFVTRLQAPALTAQRCVICRGYNIGVVEVGLEGVCNEKFSPFQEIEIHSSRITGGSMSMYRRDMAHLRLCRTGTSNLLCFIVRHNEPCQLWDTLSKKIMKIKQILWGEI